ncbi:MAG TPA: chemotaxis protein CheW, partial [Opitutaceae bacterium]|nr:chemotaxis protein CheW [Opitutaceae bacterium]
HPRIGIVVDRIAEKVRLQPHQIEETPEFKISSDTAFVRGLAYIKGTMRMLLDVDWLLARERFACEAHG